MTDVPVPTRSPHRRPDLPSLTALRAFAALAVLLYHLNRWRVTDVQAFGLGYVGVAFFFVLSGFILTWSHVPEQRARDFALRRFARIYPGHATLWAAVVLLPIAAEAVRPPDAVLNLLLLQAWDPAAAFRLNGVAWSLSCEAFFYALFPVALVLLHRLRLRTAALLAAAACVAVGGATVLAVHADAPSEVLTAFYVNPALRLPEFLAGMVLARLLAEGRRVRAVWLLPAGLVAVGGLALEKDWPAADLWLLPLIVVGIGLLAGSDLAGVRTALHAAPLLAAGRVSFAFYLVHELVVINAGRLLGPGWGTALTAALVAWAAAVALHRLVETPANRALLALAARRRAVRRPPATAGAA